MTVDWEEMLDDLDEPTIGEVTETLHNNSDLSRDAAEERILTAIDDGNLITDTESSTFETVKLPEAEDEGADDVTAAFADSIGWYNSQLDRDLPEDCDYETPREYYREGRGWNDETIEEKYLGYAPAGHKNELLRYLRDRGYDADTILATGLIRISDNGAYTIWNGRYVLPFLDSDGNPVYATSRATNPLHPSDWKENKYDKIPNGDDIEVEEPIYGTQTIKEGKPVLITEGIADAITTHQAGYPCISPVTTSFSRQDREELLNVIDAHNIPRVYIIQDSERSTFNKIDQGRNSKISDKISINQLSPGLRGALKTGDFLSENGTNVRIAKLPRHGLDKVDLDDYLNEWAGDDKLAPILSSSIPIEEHPDFGLITQNDSPQHSQTEKQTNRGESGSALFDLKITAVTGLSDGYRGTNPLGHHGNSEKYFVVNRNENFAYDHKYKVGYNPLTYLLCEADERRSDNPNGELADEEYFVAWKQAKQRGLIPDDDPIPGSALKYIAFENNFCTRNEIVDGYKLPSGAYRSAIYTVEEKYELNPGREIDSEAEFCLPDPDKTNLNSPLSGWDWRRSDQSNIHDPRNQVTDQIVKAMYDGGSTLIEALPTLGKTYGSVQAAANTPQNVTILTGRGREEQYQQLRDWCDEHGLSSYTLPSFTEDCETVRGDHGEDWSTRVRRWYNRQGLTPQEIHGHAERVLGEPLPCQNDNVCEYQSKWDFDPEEYDVLIGHYTHGYLPKTTIGRVVILDEFPGDVYFTKLPVDTPGETFKQIPLSEITTEFLQQVDEIPFANHTDLIENRSDGERLCKARLWFRTNESILDSDPDNAFINQNYHAKAPIAVYTLLMSDQLENEWERAEYDNGSIGLYNRDQGEIYIHDPPDFEFASAVIGLDGTPTKRMWDLAVGKRFEHRSVLTNDEKSEYMRNTLGYRIIRTTDSVKPYNSENHINVEQDIALTDQIIENHDRKPALITTSTAEQKYKQAGVLDRFASVDHYGNVLGSNQLKETRLGLVIGSNHYGDDYIEKWGALAGKAIRREGEGKGHDLSYTAFGDEVLRHMRQHETLQAVMRFGRDRNGAVIYVHTDTLPDWVPIHAEGREIHTWSRGMKQVLSVLNFGDEVRTKDIAEAIDEKFDAPIRERQVRTHLNKLADKGAITKTKEGRGFTWVIDAIDEVPKFGDSDLDSVPLPAGDEGSGNIAYIDQYTLNCRNSETVSTDGGSRRK